MTKEEIIKKFPFSIAKTDGYELGECSKCGYFEFCDKLLPGFIRPRKCGGPFYKETNN